MNFLDYKYKNGNFDIIGKNFIYPADIGFKFETLSEIKEIEVSRFDIFSDRVTNRSENYDKLYKVNGIQDPFSLNINQSIIITTQNYTDLLFVVKKDLILSYDKITAISKGQDAVLNPVNQERLSRIEKVLFKFGETPTELRKPIYLKTGDVQLTVEGDLIKIK